MKKNPQARPLVNPERGRLTPISLGLYNDQIAFIELQTGNSFADKLRSAVDNSMNASCAVKAIEYALENDQDIEVCMFLCDWINGDFEKLKKEFPDAPESVFPKGDNHGND
jgi:hypothetical protein